MGAPSQRLGDKPEKVHGAKFSVHGSKTSASLREPCGQITTSGPGGSSFALLCDLGVQTVFQGRSSLPSHSRAGYNC